MKVREIMQRKVKACGPKTTLEEAGNLMAEFECGFLPVIDERNRVAGVITDRDICLSLARGNRKPSKTRVRKAMTREAYCCHPEDDIREALKSMRDRKVRRLPVVGEEKFLEGILSLDDVVLEAQAFEMNGFKGPFYSDIVTTLKVINLDP